MKRQTLIALLAITLAASAAEPVFTVTPYNHKHVYESGITGFTWYSSFLFAAENTEEILQWLFVDLNIDYVRNRFLECETSNDNSNPFSINWNGFEFPPANDSNQQVYRAAKPLNSRLKLITYAHNIPDWLRVPNGIDYSNPNLYDEIAEWYFAQIINLKESDGIDCHVMDIYNEGDHTGFGKTNVGNLLKHAVPRLRALINNPARNTYGVIMPKIMAPSCLSPADAASWLTDWHDNDQGIWSNIDICSTHQYERGQDDWNYTPVNEVRGGRPFMQSEMHTAAGENNELTPALRIGEMFCSFVNNGGTAYDYYMGNSPQDAATSLIKTPWGQKGFRRKTYYSFKQFSSMQTRLSSVVPVSITNKPDSYDAIAYHYWGEQKTWLTVSCGDGTDQTILLKVNDQTGAPLPIRNIRIYETSSSRDAELVSDETLVPGRTEYRAQLPDHSVRTFEITWAGPNRLVASDDWENGDMGGGVSSGTGWSGGWVRSGSPFPIGTDHNKNIAPLFRGNSNGVASISRTLSTPLTGAGVLRFKRDVDNFGSGDSVVAEVYDGSWHQVWQATSFSNGSDNEGDSDNLDQINANISSFGPITQVRFRLLTTNPDVYFHLDDLEVVETSVGGTGLKWKGDGTSNNWVANSTPNWLAGSTPTGFTNGASVLIDDNGSNSPNINLVGSLAPAGVGVDASEDYTFGGTGSITGSGALSKRGSAKLTLTAANSYTGGTIFGQGILQLNAAGALGTGTLAIGPSDPESGLTTRVVLAPGVTCANPITIAATSPGTGQGVLGMSANGSATYSGSVTVTGDTANGGHIKGPSSGGVLSFTGPLTQAGTASAIVIRDGLVRLSGGGNYSLIKIANSTTSLGASNGVDTGATLSLGESGDATFDLNGWNQTLAAVSRQGNVATVTNSSATLATLTMAPGSEPQSYGGILAGNLALAVTTGTFELTGTSTFTRGAAVSGTATLRVHGQLTASGVVVTGGTLGGNGTIAGATTIYADATLSPGDDHVGALDFGSSLAFVGGRYKAELDSTTQAFDLVSVTSAVTLAAGANLTVIDRADPDATIPEGTRRAILDYTTGSLSGTFAGLPAASTITSGPNRFIINYADTSNGQGATGKFITLTSVGATVSYAEWSAAMNIGAQPMSADADSDGEMNLMEFSTAQNPNASTRSAPALAKNGANLELTYTRANAALADGVTFTVEWRDSLTTGAWSSAGVTEQILTDNGTVQTVRATVAAGAGSRFMRLRVVK